MTYPYLIEDAHVGGLGELFSVRGGGIVVHPPMVRVVLGWMVLKHFEWQLGGACGRKEYRYDRDLEMHHGARAK